MAIVDSRDGEIVSGKGPSIVPVEEGDDIQLQGWRIRTLQYQPADSIGSVHMARVSVFNTGSGDSLSGWISTGSQERGPVHLMLDPHHYLILLEPEPERFSSDIVLFSPGNEKIETTLEVNKPYRYMGWKLYQLSYDDAMGRWSSLSVIEAVRDPWLPVVYAGVFMLLAGAGYLFWMGQQRREGA
jgi:hypothetical protein